MSGTYDAVFWQNTPSIHQAPFMRALSRGLGKRVLVVVPTGVSEERKAMGWEDPDYGGAELRISGSREERLQILEETRKATVHVFSGIGAYPQVTEIHRALSRGTHNHIAALTESWDPRGIAGFMRKAIFRWRFTSHAGNIDTIFAIGELARLQWTSNGFEPANVVAFGYSVEGLEHDHVNDVGRNVELIFVGSFVEWKDPVTIIRALNGCTDAPWHLTMVGDGPIRQSVKRIAEELNLGSRITFIANLPNREVRQRIAASDLLVLPSQYDGWGAVVNEALMAGTPAIVSRACGSRALIVSQAQGDLFDPGDVPGLRASLAARIPKGKTSSVDRSTLMGWADFHISPIAMATYFWQRVTTGSTLRTPRGEK